MLFFPLSSLISKIFNASIENVIFPEDLKLADETPVCKKNNPKLRANYWPNILPALSKIFESCLYDQIYNNVDSILSKYQTSYKTGYSSSHSLILSALQASGSGAGCCRKRSPLLCTHMGKARGK